MATPFGSGREYYPTRVPICQVSGQVRTRKNSSLERSPRCHGGGPLEDPAQKEVAGKNPSFYVVRSRSTF